MINEWLRRERIGKGQLALFQQKIDTLEKDGPELCPGLIHGPVDKDIYKMKVKGNKGMVQLRPMLCKGPFGEFEYTLLVGAVEKDSKLVPPDAVRRAIENRQILLENPKRRSHERITQKTHR